jgi:hypothetical protein
MTHRLDLIKLRNIALHLNGDATVSVDVAVHGRQRFSISAVHRDLGAVFRESTSNGSTNTA